MTYAPVPSRSLPSADATGATVTPLPSKPPRPIPFVDLPAQQARIRPQIDAAIAKVLDHGRYVMGPEVAEFESQLAAYCGAKHVISCSNGTDALALGLMARGVRPGDAVFVPSFTFAASPEVVCWFGATPVFVDVDLDTFNMAPDSLETAIATAKAQGLTPRCVIPVDLFGQPADYAAIDRIARAHGLWTLADAAQSFGAGYGDRMVGTLGDISTTSFYPAKPLGAYGDGGAIFTDSDEDAALLRSLRDHGHGDTRYDYVRIGMNGRLDTLQAAILMEKLAIFPDEVERRQAVAARYSAELPAGIAVPKVVASASSVWAQYTIRIGGGRRDALAATLSDLGVPTVQYYPKPLHQQAPYAGALLPEGGLPNTDRLAREVLSLPIHAYLDDDLQTYIIGALARAVHALS